ncbi:MAG: hypothetical protein JETT_1663 [Candidatus Jettenia ecosi]|uniref:Uncharacterized protein n=1 Tax=Candidatus Jettenia ecosi TaxID=2494326 RepID=A0A533QBJ9_9BACT|nr:MAG: hypothetical protein JETT_1663 [Candidatus Jettenia ecosi]
MKYRGFLTCHCEGSVRNNPLNILEEIASEKTLAMTDRVILLQLMICSVSSFGYYTFQRNGVKTRNAFVISRNKYSI